MAPIVSTIEIARSPAEVFPYVTDPATFPEWQRGVVAGALDRAPGVGARCTTKRKIGGATREVTTELTEFDPPARWADRGVDGPIRAIVSVDIEPLGGGQGSRVTISVDFEGRGIGRLVVPLIVRGQAAREMPENMANLKGRLEACRDPA
jgi:uncharacterized protein YndB with AHSA1/START domain